MCQLANPPLFDINEYKEYKIITPKVDNISVVKSIKNSNDPMFDIACSRVVSDTLKRIGTLNDGHATIDFADLAAMAIIGRAISTDAIAAIIRICAQMVDDD